MKKNSQFFTQNSLGKFNTRFPKLKIIILTVLGYIITHSKDYFFETWYVAGEWSFHNEFTSRKRAPFTLEMVLSLDLLK